MKSKGIIGLSLIFVMGFIIFSVVMLIGTTMSDVAEKCAECGDDCEMESCSEDTSNTANMFSKGLIAVYAFSSLGIMYFSFKEDEKDEHEAFAPTPANTDEYAYG